MARSGADRTIKRFVDALLQIEGAYALVILTNKKLIGARDPFGIRPLVLGNLDGSYILHLLNPLHISDFLIFASLK